MKMHVLVRACVCVFVRVDPLGTFVILQRVKHFF